MQTDFHTPHQECFEFPADQLAEKMSLLNLENGRIRRSEEQATPRAMAVSRII